MSKSKYIITITRQFGSMGRPIAQKLADILDIEYYDRALIDMAAERLGLPSEQIGSEEESAEKQHGVMERIGGANYTSFYERMAYPLGTKSSAMQDQIFETQKNLIQFLAEKDTCVIVGRCSDFVLSESENAMHVYIYASFEERLRHSMEDLKLSEDEARHMISKVDQARENYHVNYAGYKPDDKRFKDIMIDSSFLGIDGTAEYLADAVQRKFGV